jgi:hypothetical protein
MSPLQPGSTQPIFGVVSNQRKEVIQCLICQPEVRWKSPRRFKASKQPSVLMDKC